MLRRLSLGFAFTLAATLVAACGTARIVNRTQYGGTIALEGDRSKAMEQAQKEMAAHCGPGNYTVVSEGEVPIGTDTAGRSDSAVNKDGTVTETNGTSTRTATEWRVTYQCGAGAGAPPPEPPPPVGAPTPEGGPPPPPGY